MSAAPDILKLDVVKPTSHNPTHSHTLLRVDGAGPSSLSYSLCRVEGSGPLRGAQREEECDKLGSQILRWIGTKPTPRPTGIYTAHEKSALLQQEYADFLVRCAEHDADLNFLKKTNRSEAVKLYSTPLGCWYLRHRQPSREDHQDILRSRGLHSGHSVGVWYPPQPHHGKVVGKRFSDDIERRYKPKRVAAPKLEIGKHTPNVIAFSPPRKPPAQDFSMPPSRARAQSLAYPSMMDPQKRSAFAFGGVDFLSREDTGFSEHRDQFDDIIRKLHDAAFVASG